MVKVQDIGFLWLSDLHFLNITFQKQQIGAKNCHIRIFYIKSKTSNKSFKFKNKNTSKILKKPKLLFLIYLINFEVEKFGFS